MNAATTSHHRDLVSGVFNRDLEESNSLHGFSVEFPKYFCACSVSPGRQSYVILYQLCFL